MNERDTATDWYTLQQSTVSLWGWHKTTTTTKLHWWGNTAVRDMTVRARIKMVITNEIRRMIRIKRWSMMVCVLNGGKPYVITAKSDCLWLQSSGGLLLLDLLPPDTRSCVRVVHKTCVSTLSVVVQMVQLRWCWWWCWRWSLWLFSPAPPSSREYGWKRLRCVCRTLLQLECGFLEFAATMEELPWWTMFMTERSFSQQRKPAVAWSTMGLG